MRLVFAGTPEPAVPSLRALAASAHDIVGVVTRADAPLGRKRTMTPSPVAREAEAQGLDILRTNRLGVEASDRVRAWEPDLGVIVAYGGLVREPLLSAPRLGWINLHFSLLPRWRGAAPVQHALIAGDRVTGASVFQLVPELDAGDLLGAVHLEVPRTATAGRLLDDLAVVGAELLVDVVDRLAAGLAEAIPQSGEVTLAPKLSIDDGRIRWHESASRVLDRIRGVTPEPGAHTSVGGGRLKVIEADIAGDPAAAGPAAGVITQIGRDVVAGAGEGALRLVRVQPAGRPVMEAEAWWRGLRTDQIIVDDDVVAP